MPALKTPRITSPHQNTAQTPSPNYFGFQTNESNSFLTGSSAQHAKANWSPPSSAVRSTAAISPTVIPIDQRPEYAAFRTQSDGKVFNLGDLGSFNNSSLRPSAPRSRTTSSKEIPQAVNTSRARKPSLDSNRLEVSQSPKRVLSPGSLQYLEQAKRSSPATDGPPSAQGEQSRTNLPLERQARGAAVPKPYTQTTSNDNNIESEFLSAEKLANILESDDSFLLLDLRVSTQYSMSHISGSLNLCIPTTLLKRPSFNVQKLCDTFKDDDQKAEFEQWQRCKYIIVYDNASAQLKDATICVNTIKKFQTEGYTGCTHILRGGFLEFSRRYPAHVDLNNHSLSSSPDRQVSDGDGPHVAPVAGGCPMPATDNAANPFFGNIRQNMDLIGGVGQIALQHPQQATKEVEERFPAWLKKAADESDRGEHVAKKFELIERREKKRMEEALSGKVAWGTPTDSHDSVRIAGLEKGSKNRYNNIYPFEHSRVKLAGVPSHGCDYVNASHIKAAWSHKRYISTQAPIPATFSDFWNVIWQQDVRVIVMLTAEKEGAQVKAHNYWESKKYGSLHLDFLSEKRASIDFDKIKRRKQRPAGNHRHPTNPILAEIKEEKPGDEPYVVVRRFSLSHGDYPFERMREVTQLQYSGWPDLGTPAHPKHLIGLVTQCDAVVRSINKTSMGDLVPANHRPVLVHCSAGCGRTGTFCTVDSVIDMIKRQQSARRPRHTSPMDLDQSPPSQARAANGGFFTSQSVLGGEGGNTPDGDWVGRDDLDLVEKTVEDFRLQRISMVQSLRQYVLCYESIMEWLVDQELEPASA
ncbi:hypothetical protein AMS68_000482 [Peltaster fructicola]|uniref:protein-tyrosine-phosphatase n=1 Tax=Peltaster fructicola TaxID=286661 RepID=A0A6H0XK17_9PEZI|nr:hypothetical protein AMS68_000482 [Peltaster fructicola]